METWKPVVGFEGMYEVSDRGRVKSVTRTVMRKNGWPLRISERIRKLHVGSSHGYLAVNLREDGTSNTRTVHSLVAEAFHGPCPEGMEVLHRNGEKHDNRAENLRYGTRAENMQDMIQHGTHPPSAQTHCLRGHLLEGENLSGAKLRKGVRSCKSCELARGYVRYHGKGDLQEISDRRYREIMGET